MAGVSPEPSKGSMMAKRQSPPKERKVARSMYHRDWSVFPMVTVNFAFGRKLTFVGMKRYVTVGQLRELVATELYLPSTYVALANDGAPMLTNAMLLEDIFGAECNVYMSYMTMNSKNYPYSVLWGMTVHSPVRRFFIWLVEWPWFDNASLVLIILNVLTMMFQRPVATEPNAFDYFNAWAEPFFSIAFTIEMLCKLLASGIVLTPHTYLRDGWNWIDAAVVLSAWITWEQPGVVVMFDPNRQRGGDASINPFKTLRTIRVLRPLRTVTRVRGMRVVVQALLRSLPEMASVIAILIFIFVFFSIFGVQLFAGKLRWRCVPDVVVETEPCAQNLSVTDDDPLLDRRRDCMPTAFSDACEAAWENFSATPPSCLPLWASSNQLGTLDSELICDGYVRGAGGCPNQTSCTYFTSNPNNNMTSFDHFPGAFITIFYSMTLEGWVDTMYMLLRGNTTLAWATVPYFIVLILFASIFVFNLLLAVVFDNFAAVAEDSRLEAEAEDAEKHDGEARLVKEGSHESSTMEEGRSVTLQSEHPPSHSRFKSCVESRHFETLIITCILINTCIMALDWSPPPFGLTVDGMRSLQLATSAIFGVVFTLEMICLMCAYGVCGYFKSYVRCFDFFIVICSITEVFWLLTVTTTGGSAVVGSVLRTLKGTRTLRLLRLMLIVDGMNKVLITITKSAAHILYLFAILVLFCIIFALLGMETMATAMYQSDSPYNFNNIYNGLINVFIVLSGENWNDLFFSAAEYVTWYAPIYYIVLLIWCNWILLNLFVAILLANINELSVQEERKKLDDAKKLLKAAKGTLKRMTTKRIPDAVTGKAESSSNCARDPASGAQPQDEEEVKPVSPPPSPPPIERERILGNLVPEDPGCLRMSCYFLSWTLGTHTETSVKDETYIRGGLRQLVEHWVFAATIQVLILCSSLLLIVALPGTLTGDLEATLAPVLQVAEDVFTIIFTIEALLKLGAYGVCGYFHNNFNRLDFFVVCISWLTIGSFTEGDDADALSSLRALRSIRMLKLAALFEGMRVVIMALYQSGPAIANVMMVLSLFLVIFGILGMQLNAGRWGFCELDIFDGNPYASTKAGREFTVLSRTECVEVRNSTWMVPHYGSFDNIFSSMLILFEMSTLERWPDAMLYMADAAWNQTRALDTPPVPNEDGSIYGFVLLFWVTWIFISAFVIMNLFVGVVVEAFQQNKARSDGMLFLTERQQKWVLVMSVVSKRRSPQDRVVPKSKLPCRRTVFRLVTSPVFEIFIMAAILISVISMTTVMDDALMADSHYELLKVLNIVFWVVFVIEMCLKQYGLGPRAYFSDRWNCFDFILVVFTTTDVIIDLTGSESAIDPVFIRSFRLVRVGRLLRLIRGFKPMLRMFDTLLTSLPALVNVIGLLALLLIIYAIAGVDLFYDVRPMDTQFLDAELGGVVSFDSFFVALLTLFRCVTGESWNGIMHDLMINYNENPGLCAPPRKCANPVFAVIYFVSFTVFATFMLLNLLIGVVLQSFSNTLQSDSIRCIVPEQIELFTKGWRAVDPKGTHVLHEHKLPMLLHRLRVHSWVYNTGPDAPISIQETVLLSRRLRIPVRNNHVNFQETLQQISRAIHHGFDKAQYEELVELETERFRPTDPALLETAAGSSHDEVARARARMRRHLQGMHRKSLVRTGQIARPKIRFKGTSKRAQRNIAACIVQTFWRQLEMRRAARSSRLGKERTEALHTAIRFIVFAKTEVTYKKYGVDAVTYVKPAPVPDRQAADDLQTEVYNSDALDSLFGTHTNMDEERPPMSTAYASMIIQTAFHMMKERRTFRFLRFHALRWQARVRGRMGWHKLKKTLAATGTEPKLPNKEPDGFYDSSINAPEDVLLSTQASAHEMDSAPTASEEARSWTPPPDEFAPPGVRFAGDNGLLGLGAVNDLPFSFAVYAHGPPSSRPPPSAPPPSVPVEVDAAPAEASPRSRRRRRRSLNDVDATREQGHKQHEGRRASPRKRRAPQ